MYASFFLSAVCLRNIPNQFVYIFRSTSPTYDKAKQVRTRVARTTDPIIVEQRRSRKPRVVDGK